MPSRLCCRNLRVQLVDNVLYSFFISISYSNERLSQGCRLCNERLLRHNEQSVVGFPWESSVRNRMRSPGIFLEFILDLWRFFGGTSANERVQVGGARLDPDHTP